MTNLLGQNLLGRFRVDEFIASGGMGAVYRVWDVEHGAPFAMKVLRSDLVEDPAVIDRFQREAHALERLAHPNIVPFYGLYVTDDFAFLIAQYVDGITLKELLKKQQGQPLSIPEVLTYLKALSAALGYAHSQGFIHCDVKPGNVIVDRSGSILLMDFGIARYADRTTSALAMLGTPAYMTPEQIQGELITPRTDVYALGVMTFEMLTGRRLFYGEMDGGAGSSGPLYEQVRGAHLNTPSPDPRNLNPALPESLAAVILRTLAKDPEERYANVMNFFRAACDASGYRPENVGDRFDPRDKLRSENYPQPNDFLQSDSLPSPIPPVVSDVQAMTHSPAALGGQPIIGQTPVPPPVVQSPYPMIIPVVNAASVPVGASRIPRVVGVLLALAVLAVIFLCASGLWVMRDQFLGMALPAPTFTRTRIAVLYTSTGEATPIPSATLKPTLLPSETPLPSTATQPLPTNTPALGVGSQATSLQDGMLQVYVPAGEFTMGSNDKLALASERPQHNVYLDAYWIDQTEVTNAMYAQCVSAGGCGEIGRKVAADRTPYYGEDEYDNYPVIHVSWNQANQYCEWAGRRLPTEAEWEKAARGTDGRLYPWGNKEPNCTLAHSWGFFYYDSWNENVGKPVGCSNLPSDVQSHPGGASPYGVYDMLGNVGEWVADWYDSQYYSHSPNENPTGPGSGKGHVIRGALGFFQTSEYYWLRYDGHLYDYGDYVLQTRVTARSFNSAHFVFYDLGFRCVATP